MGQQGSKSSIEARVVFQRLDTESSTRMDESSSPTSVRIQKKMNNKSASPSFSGRLLAPEKCQRKCCSGSRGDPDELEYVMDDPTGGVWVKSKERWTRS